MRQGVNYYGDQIGTFTYVARCTGPWGKKHIFVGTIVRVNDYYEVDLKNLDQIDFGGRSTSAYIIHTLPSSRAVNSSGLSGRKICVNSGKEPRTPTAAKDLFMGWADCIAEYIVTGKTPDEQIAEAHRRSNYR